MGGINVLIGSVKFAESVFELFSFCLVFLRRCWRGKALHHFFYLIWIGEITHDAIERRKQSGVKIKKITVIFLSFLLFSSLLFASSLVLILYYNVPPSQSQRKTRKGGKGMSDKENFLRIFLPFVIFSSPQLWFLKRNIFLLQVPFITNNFKVSRKQAKRSENES